MSYATDTHRRCQTHLIAVAAHRSFLRLSKDTQGGVPTATVPLSTEQGARGHEVASNEALPAENEWGFLNQPDDGSSNMSTVVPSIWSATDDDTDTIETASVDDDVFQHAAPAPVIPVAAAVAQPPMTPADYLNQRISELAYELVASHTAPDSVRDFEAFFRQSPFPALANPRLSAADEESEPTAAHMSANDFVAAQSRPASPLRRAAARAALSYENSMEEFTALFSSRFGGPQNSWHG